VDVRTAIEAPGNLQQVRQVVFTQTKFSNSIARRLIACTCGCTCGCVGDTPCSFMCGWMAFTIHGLMATITIVTCLYTYMHLTAYC
jgi:hypothetical protein